MSEFLSRRKAAVLYWIGILVELFFMTYKTLFGAAVSTLAGRHWADLEPGDKDIVIAGILLTVSDPVIAFCRKMLLRLREDKPLDGDTQIFSKTSDGGVA